MKLFRIFTKNLKVVSRNWVYFLVLFIFPILLIVVAGIMLNSNDFNNVKIGVVNENPEYYLNSQNFKNAQEYNSLAECLLYLTNHKVSSCIHVRESKDGQSIDVYLDNTQKIVEYYSRQFILERLLEEQFGILKQTSYQISEQLSIYSSSISEASTELADARGELRDQENVLINYRNKLTVFRNDFNSVYWELKAVEPDIKRMRDNAANAQDIDIAGLRSDVQQSKSDVALLKGFLSSRLSIGDYDYADDRLDSIEDTLSEVDYALLQIQNSGNVQSMDQVLQKVDTAITKLDEIKVSLDQLDSDLADAIARTQNSISKVDEFINKLDDAQRDIDDFSNNLGTSFVSINFNKAFNVPDDPVLTSFPQLITIIIAFSSLILSNKFVSNEVRKPSYRREIIAPTRDITYLLADYLINLFFILIQVFVLFLLGVLWFGVPITAFYIFVFSILLTASVLIFAGISLGYLIKTESISMLSTIFLVMFLLIFSDLLMPSVLTGPVIKFFIGLNPFVILNSILADVVLLHETTAGLEQMFVKLFILLISSGFIAYLSKKASREDTIQ